MIKPLHKLNINNVFGLIVCSFFYYFVYKNFSLRFLDRALFFANSQFVNFVIIYITICFICIMYSFNYKTDRIQTVIIFICLFLMLPVAMSFPQNVVTFIQDWSVSSLWLFVFVFFLSIYQPSYFEINFIRYLMVGLLIVASLSFILLQFKIGIVGLLQLNDIYYVICLLPWVLLLKGKYKYFLLIVVSLLTIISLKRTALLIISVIWITDLLYKDGKSTIMSKIIFCCIIICIYSYLTFFLDLISVNIINRFSNLLEDGGSGRIPLYIETISLIFKSNIINFIFGHGLNSVKDYTSSGLSAHNDFLEVFFDFGVFSFILYLGFHFYILKYTIFCIKKKTAYSSAFISSYIIFLFLSLFSHLVIYPSYFLYLVSFWGIMISNIKFSKIST